LLTAPVASSASVTASTVAGPTVVPSTTIAVAAGSTVSVAPLVASLLATTVAVVPGGKTIVVPSASITVAGTTSDAAVVAASSAAIQWMRVYIYIFISKEEARKF
jgi:hypothetical protein